MSGSAIDLIGIKLGGAPKPSRNSRNKAVKQCAIGMILGQRRTRDVARVAISWMTILALVDR
jgi:hypothetical protein